MSREIERKAPDFGEPWESRSDMDRSRDGSENWYTELFDEGNYRVELGHSKNGDNNLDRIAVCINALAGCPDPEAFINKVQEAVREFDGGLRDKALDDPALSWLREDSK